MRPVPTSMCRAAPLLLLLAACGRPEPRPDGPAGLDVIPPLRGVTPLATDFDVEHYALELRLHPVERRIEGACRVRLFPLVDRLRTVNLDLVGLRVETVSDRDGRELDHAHFDGRLRIELAQPAPRGRALELEIRYGGSPAVWVGDPASHLAVAKGCEHARAWFPCQDHPQDRATTELVLDLPRGWTSVAGGERVEAREVGERRRERWRMHAAHPPHLAGFVAGDLRTVTSEWDGVPITLHAPRGWGDRLQVCLDAADEAVDFLSRTTGRRYPFPGFAIACLEGTPGHGVEPAGLTTFGVDALADDRGRADGVMDERIVHATAHQWFGALVTPRDWSETWLTEGFATYLTELWVEETRGAEDFHLHMDRAIEVYLDAHGARPRPIVFGRCREPYDLFVSGHVDLGGATRLHLLRHVLGDEAFFAGVRRYVGENAGRSVTTADLRGAFERASGRDLERFFDHWLRAPGHPELEVFWGHDADRGRVLLTVNQIHEIQPGVPDAFEAPLDVELGFPDGPRRFRLDLAGRRELFDLEAEEAPRWVIVDPDRWLPARIRARRGAEEWLAMAVGAGPVGRLRATRALGTVTRSAQGEERAARLQVIVERLTSDGRPEVRAAAARSLGQVGGAAARAALIEAARNDAASSVRAAALQVLTAVGGDQELAELGRELVRVAPSWQVVGAAASLVASADPQGAGGWLRNRLASSEPNALGEPHVRLLPALVAAEGPLALDALRSAALDADAPGPLRVVAAGLLGHAAPDPDRIAVLGELLRSDRAALRSAAVFALVRWDDEAARRLLAAYYPGSGTTLERRAIERALGLG